MKIIAVTAWRHWIDAEFIRLHLLRLHPNLHGAPFHVRVGDADGGDEIVRWWCKERGVSHTVFCADWGLGKQAGPIRNRRMLKGEGDPVAGPTELLVAFPGRRRPVKVPGSGSWGCCIEAALMGIEVRIPPYRNSGE